MFKDGIDTGYKDNPNWWFDPSDPDCFRIEDLDQDYPSEYFPLAEPPNVEKFVDTFLQYFQQWSGQRVRKILEFGSGGGWYLKALQDKGYAVHGFEGSPWGVAQCHSRGVGKMNISLADLRLPMERKFRKADVALFTEVAEHIAIPFHGTVVYNLVTQAHAVWFSTETPDVPNRPHIHHPSELPLSYWKMMFKFFEYECHEIPQEVNDGCWGRAQCIFYNPKFYRR